MNEYLSILLRLSPGTWYGSSRGKCFSPLCSMIKERVYHAHRNTDVTASQIIIIFEIEHLRIALGHPLMI